MTLLDKILIYALGYSICCNGTYCLIKNLAASIFISFLLIVFFRAVVLHVYVRRKNKKVISVSEMENELALYGGEQVNFLLRSVGAFFQPEKTDNGFFILYENKKIYVVANYKFSSTGLDESAKFYRFAKQNGACEIWILGRAPARNVLLFCSGLDVMIKFIPSKKLHAYLKKQNALMPKRIPLKNPKKPKFKHIFDGAFTKKRAKYFALSGLCLSFYAAIGIMRIYYLLMCAVCFVFAVICLLKRD